MGRKKIAPEDRKINVPSWSVKVKYILGLERIAEERKTTPSEILNSILAEFCDTAKSTPNIS